jgi:class 3 adenylate cyclase
MSESRKLVAILVADVVGYSKLAGADEERTLARLRGLRSDLFDPAVTAHRGRVVKRTGDGSIVEFRSVVDAVRCGIEIQDGLFDRNSGVPNDRRIRLRIGIHLGDVVEEGDGDLMGDGVNIAARLESIAKPGAIALSEDAYRQIRGRIELAISDLGPKTLKNITEPIRVYSIEPRSPPLAKRNRPRHLRSYWVFALVAPFVVGTVILWRWSSESGQKTSETKNALGKLICRPVAGGGGSFTPTEIREVSDEEVRAAGSEQCDVVYHVGGKYYDLGGCNLGDLPVQSSSAATPFGARHGRLALDCR